MPTQTQSQPTASARRGRPISKAQDISDIPFVDAYEEIGEATLASLDSFVVPARDDRGQSSHLHLNLPPYLLRQIQIICKSSRFPYLEPGDLIRHAIHRHLHWCTLIRKTLDPHINQILESMSETARDYEFQTRSREVFDHLDQLVEKYIASGHGPEAVRLLAVLDARVKGAAKSPQQEKARAEVLKRYGNLLMAGPAKEESQQ